MRGGLRAGKARSYDPRMTFLIAFIVPMVIGLWAQHRVKSTFARNLQVPASHGLTGAEVARRVLDANGLQEVPIEETPGSLSDHYDPRNRSVHLSPDVYHGRSISSTAVGAHEVGHAIQHAQAYAFFKFRSAMFPAVAFASQIWLLFLIGGLFLNILGFIYVAVALYSVAVLFQFVTLARRVRRLESREGTVARSRPRRLERGDRRPERPEGRSLDIRGRRARSDRDAPVLPLDAPEPVAREPQS